MFCKHGHNDCCLDISCREIAELTRKLESATEDKRILSLKWKDSADLADSRLAEIERLKAEHKSFYDATVKAGLETFAKLDSAKLQVKAWKEKSEAWEASCREIARKADAVMKALEQHGPSIVPHLLDTDDNDGEFLRREIRLVGADTRVCACPPLTYQVDAGTGNCVKCGFPIKADDKEKPCLCGSSVIRKYGHLHSCKEFKA